MSLDLAVAWVRRVVCVPQAVDDSIKALRQADRAKHCASILVGPQLTHDAKGWLMRWTGHEVIVVGLSRRDQRGLGLKPGRMLHNMEPRTADLERPLKQVAALSDVAISDARRLRREASIVGTCQIGTEQYLTENDAKWSLRAIFFNPNIKGRLTTYWHLKAPLTSGTHGARFTLPPLKSEHLSVDLGLPMAVVFLQIVAAEDRQTMRGLRGISNTTATIVEVRP